jgi:hypothetical protein
MAPFGCEDTASLRNSTDNFAISKSLWFNIKVEKALLYHPLTVYAMQYNGK